MTQALTRCAVYTRKSSEEGLDQDFNSLDAQRESGEAYIRSQSGEGWRIVNHRYDDGGHSGATLERPSLQRLLADVGSGKINVVVVYKIDRLTRSLADFARIVEIFDRQDVSFVSVTQAFNTTSSMGRLTLNVLLSFAQFEREVTAERIRDKIALSKSKGMWMGGKVPLGYDLPTPGSRALVLNPKEAVTVRTIFKSYLELGSVHALERWLTDQGITSKRYLTRGGKLIGGQPLSRGALFHLLRNRTYLGMIVHKDDAYPGQHAAIIEPKVFDDVQDQLNGNARRLRARKSAVASSPLAGRIFDCEGTPMSPAFSYGKGGKLYRYYVATELQKGRQAKRTNVGRVSAAPLERALVRYLQTVIGTDTASPLDLITRIDLSKRELHCQMPVTWLHALERSLPLGGRVAPDPSDPAMLRLTLPFVRRAGQIWVIPGEVTKPRPDPTLIKALRQAHSMVDWDKRGRPSLVASPETPHRRRLIRLAFLAPSIQRAILDGRQPRDLTLARLLACPIPLDWAAQKQAFGFNIS